MVFMLATFPISVTKHLVKSNDWKKGSASGLRVQCFMLGGAGAVEKRDSAATLLPRQETERFGHLPFTLCIYPTLDLSTWNGAARIQDGWSHSS